MEFLNGIRCYETFISQILHQKINLKSRPHILRVIQQFLSEEYLNHPTRKQPNGKA
jgi:hypothetical protein